jgi:hypothetical protein
VRAWPPPRRGRQSRPAGREDCRWCQRPAACFVPPLVTRRVLLAACGTGAMCVGSNGKQGGSAIAVVLSGPWRPRAPLRASPHNRGACLRPRRACPVGALAWAARVRRSYASPGRWKPAARRLVCVEASSRPAPSAPRAARAPRVRREPAPSQSDPRASRQNGSRAAARLCWLPFAAPTLTICMGATRWASGRFLCYSVEPRATTACGALAQPAQARACAGAKSACWRPERHAARAPARGAGIGRERAGGGVGGWTRGALPRAAGAARGAKVWGGEGRHPAAATRERARPVC